MVNAIRFHIEAGVATEVHETLASYAPFSVFEGAAPDFKLAGFHGRFDTYMTNIGFTFAKLLGGKEQKMTVVLMQRPSSIIVYPKCVRIVVGTYQSGNHQDLDPMNYFRCMRCINPEK